jgi:hypothetical protein
MHPIDRIRLETHVALIRVKEISSGFRVLSAGAVLIDGLPEEHKNNLRGRVLNNQTKKPENVCCEVMVVVDAVTNCTLLYDYVFGDYSGLASMHDEITSSLLLESLIGRQAKMIQMLNKEI